MASADSSRAFGPGGVKRALTDSERAEAQGTAKKRTGSFAGQSVPMVRPSQLHNVAGAPVGERAPGAWNVSVPALDTMATDGAGLMTRPTLDRFESVRAAAMEMTFHDDLATQSGNSQSDHQVTDSVVLSPSFYGSDYFKIEAMQRRLPQHLPIMCLENKRVEKEMDPRLHLETVAQINWRLYQRTLTPFCLHEWNEFKRKLTYQGSILHMLHNPDGGRLLTFATLVVDGRVDLANLWLNCSTTPKDGSRLFLLGVRCTEGKEEEERRRRETERPRRPSTADGERDLKNTYWRFEPYVMDKPGTPDMDLWNDWDWEGLCIYVGRVMECGGSLGEPGRYRHMIQSVLHPRSENYGTQAYHDLIEGLPRITVSLGFGGGF